MITWTNIFTEHIATSEFKFDNEIILITPLSLFYTPVYYSNGFIYCISHITKKIKKIKLTYKPNKLPSICILTKKKN